MDKGKFGIGEIVIHNHKNREIGVIVDYFPDEKFCYSVRFGKEYHNMAEHQLLPFIGEKELDLFRLLKGHEEKIFYSPIYGDVVIEFDKDEAIEMYPMSKDAYLPIAPNGHLRDNPNCGNAILWPSRELYEKYPLDPRAAWLEWFENYKQNRWRAEKGKEYWYFDGIKCCKAKDSYTPWDTNHYNLGNYFCTEEEAQKAAKEVEQALEQFHKKNE